MQLFFAPDINGNSYTLHEEESKHCVRVLRLVEGDPIHLVDGRGNLFTAQIANQNAKRCEVVVTDVKTEFGKRSFHLHIAIAPTKNIERLEWMLEKCTEIGIDEFTMLRCEHSERKEVNSERLEKIIIAAMKQSVKAYLPKLNGMVPLRQFVQQSITGDKYIAHCHSWDLPPLRSSTMRENGITIMIGPEGDFSPAEVDLALQNGFKEISLGASRLRTETAGVVACTVANLC